jgi:hypothetical protein
MVMLIECHDDTTTIIIATITRARYGAGPSFLYGSVGIMAVGIIVKHLCKRITKRDSLLRSLVEMVPVFYDLDAYPDEMLYGRAGTCAHEAPVHTNWR